MRLELIIFPIALLVSVVVLVISFKAFSRAKATRQNRFEDQGEGWAFTAILFSIAAGLAL